MGVKSPLAGGGVGGGMVVGVGEVCCCPLPCGMILPKSREFDNEFSAQSQNIVPIARAMKEWQDVRVIALST